MEEAVKNVDLAVAETLEAVEIEVLEVEEIEVQVAVATKAKALEAVAAEAIKVKRKADLVVLKEAGRSKLSRYGYKVRGTKLEVRGKKDVRRRKSLINK